VRICSVLPTDADSASFFSPQATVKNTEKDGRSHCLLIKRGAGEGSTVLSFSTLGEANTWKAVIETSAKSPHCKMRLRMRVKVAL
jgi:hypothetical protein